MINTSAHRMLKRPAVDTSAQGISGAFDTSAGRKQHSESQQMKKNTVPVHYHQKSLFRQNVRSHHGSLHPRVATWSPTFDILCEMMPYPPSLRNYRESRRQSCQRGEGARIPPIKGAVEAGACADCSFAIMEWKGQRQARRGNFHPLRTHKTSTLRAK